MGGANSEVIHATHTLTSRGNFGQRGIQVGEMPFRSGELLSVPQHRSHCS
jgi:hypothetical protein